MFDNGIAYNLGFTPMCQINTVAPYPLPGQTAPLQITIPNTLTFSQTLQTSGNFRINFPYVEAAPHLSSSNPILSLGQGTVSSVSYTPGKYTFDIYRGPTSQPTDVCFMVQIY